MESHTHRSYCNSFLQPFTDAAHDKKLSQTLARPGATLHTSPQQVAVCKPRGTQPPLLTPLQSAACVLAVNPQNRKDPNSWSTAQGQSGWWWLGTWAMIEAERERGCFRKDNYLKTGLWWRDTLKRLRHSRLFSISAVCISFFASLLPTDALVKFTFPFSELKHISVHKRAGQTQE